jgi:tetratricopeptide (TPR) repeat protein
MAPPSRPPRREPGQGPRRSGGPAGRPSSSGGAAGGRGRAGGPASWVRPAGGGRSSASGRPSGSGRPARAGERRDAPPRRGDDAPRPGGPRKAAPGAGGRGRGPAADSPKTAKWGGVARRGARNLDEAKPGTAAAAWRDAAARADRDREKARGRRSSDDQDEWVDGGIVRDEAEAAVSRAASPAPKPARRRKEVPEEVAEDVAKAAGPNWAARVKDRLADATRAYEAERYRDAKRMLEGLLERAPSAVAVRELLGLTYYRLGKWRDAIRELGAVELLTGSVDHHPVIADCHRALGQMDAVERLWDELRRTGAEVAVVIEGRIVMAGALADKKRFAEAVKVLEQGPIDVRKPHEHHLRLWYALADLYEKAGDVARARSLFTRLATADPEFADVLDRLDSLGG